jgi:hypothetical protein
MKEQVRPKSGISRKKSGRGGFLEVADTVPRLPAAIIRNNNIVGISVNVPFAANFRRRQAAAQFKSAQPQVTTNKTQNMRMCTIKKVDSSMDTS